MKETRKNPLCGMLARLAALGAALLTLLVLPTSCSEENLNREVEYLPFQESKDGSWGLISTSGEVLFSEEFNQQPTIAINGRFLVKNADNLWEIYTAEKKPKKVGSEYLAVGLFYEDVAPAVEKGQPIKFIDRDGKVKVTLDKIDGKAVAQCSNFIHGQAKVKVGDYWGAVNTSGKVVIEPKYCWLFDNNCGTYLAIDKKYEDVTDQNEIVYTVLSSSGKELGSVKGSKIKGIYSIRSSYHTVDNVFDDAVVVKTEKGDNDVMGLLGFDGEWKVGPLSKAKSLDQRMGGHYVFGSGDGYGLLDKNGEEVIRAKYKSLMLLDDDILAGRKSGDSDYSLYTLDDEKVGKEEYKQIFYFFDGKNAFAQAGKHDWVLINKKGEEQKLKTDIYNIEVPTGYFYMESDYLDLDELVSRLRITSEGVLGLTASMTGPQIVDALNGISGAGANLSTKARDYPGGVNASLKMGKATVDCWTEGQFVSQKRSGGWFSYTTYEWSSNPVDIITLHIGTVGTGNPQLKGNVKELYTKISDAVKAKGKVVKDGKNAVLVSADNDCSYYVANAGAEMYVFFGKLNPDSCTPSDLDAASEDNPVGFSYPTPKGVAPVADGGDEDWGELESPPADDL